MRHDRKIKVALFEHRRFEVSWGFLEKSFVNGRDGEPMKISNQM